MNPTVVAMIYFIIPLIFFLFWLALGHSSDDASAIESFHSVDSDDDDRQEVQEEVVRKSATEIEFSFRGCLFSFLL